MTHDEILGKGRTVTPHPVPFGYQVEQWERNRGAFEQAKVTNPTLEYQDFMLGWNAAFSEIYRVRED